MALSELIEASSEIPYFLAAHDWAIDNGADEATARLFSRIILMREN